MLSILVYLLIITALALWVGHPAVSHSNSLNLQNNTGEALECWLKNFQWGNRSEVPANHYLPKYKFYTEVIEVLLNLARKMGGNYQESLLFLREGLQSDRQFEKKIKEAVIGTWLQIGMISALTWMFIIGALSLIDVKIPLMKLAMIFFWQALGCSLLPFLLAKLRRHYFGDIGKIWKMLYVLRSLAKVPLSRSEILTLACVQELKAITQKSLEAIVEKLKDTCQRALKQGGNYEDDVKYLMGELRFQEKWHFELFEKRLVVIKLALLSVFFLPSYLAFVFLLLGDLMLLM